MNKTLGMLGAVMMLATSAGCSAAPADSIDNRMSTSENLSGGVETAVWKAVPAKANAEVVVHAEHVYPANLQDKCGPDYALDLLVDFGTATTERHGFAAVTAFYLPHAGNVVVPRRLDTWMQQGDAHAVTVSGLTYGPGEKVRYDVVQDYLLDPNDPVVVLELETAGGRAPSDPACIHVARFAFYPVIAR
jgi:hypothetical protein